MNGIRHPALCREFHLPKNEIIFTGDGLIDNGQRIRRHKTVVVIEKNDKTILYS